jgi:trehalose-6-phosphate synthase
VLVLSQFAGAAQQLQAAVLVNPLRIGQAAQGMAQALRMPAIEQARRMRVLRANVSAYDASWWARQMVEDATRHCEKRGLRERPAEQWASAVA